MRSEIARNMPAAQRIQHSTSDARTVERASLARAGKQEWSTTRQAVEHLLGVVHLDVLADATQQTTAARRFAKARTLHNHLCPSGARHEHDARDACRPRT